MITNNQKFGVSRISYAHQDCIYLIKNTVKFNIITKIIQITLFSILMYFKM